MPAALIYRKPGDNKRQAGATSFNTERENRRRSISKRERYYYGDQETFLDKAEGEPDDNVIINMTKMIIDRTMTFVAPTMPEFILDAKVPEQTEDEEWLEDVWLANGGLSLLHEIIFNGAVSGHAYVRITDDDELGYPRIIPIDSRRVTTYWKADDSRTVIWHEVTWEIEDVKYIVDYVNNLDGTWSIIEYTSKNGTKWAVSNRTEWRSAVPPIIHTKHLPNPNQFYGLPELPTLGLQDKLNLIASENARIIRYYSSPKTVATGVNPEDVQQTAINSLYAIPKPDAKVYNLEMDSELAASMTMLEVMHTNILAENRVIVLRGEVKDFQRVTNAGVRTIFLDPLSKNIILRDNYGRLLQDISRAIFFAAGRGEIKRPTVIHADPLPVDQTEEVNVDAIERAMNIVSRQTVSQRRGLNWATELEYMRQESEQEFLNPSKAEGNDLSPNSAANQKPTP